MGTEAYIVRNKLLIAGNMERQRHTAVDAGGKVLVQAVNYQWSGVLFFSHSAHGVTFLSVIISTTTRGFLGGLKSKESACSAGDPGSIPGSGRSPGGGHGNPLQYSCVENSHGQRSLVDYSP